MATALFTHPDFDAHVTPEGHPERVARLQAIRAALSASGFDALDRREAPIADRADLLRVHPEAYVAQIEAAIPDGGSRGA
jgi:acetoin utilization deacetylase AcuC-like enzyme